MSEGNMSGLGRRKAERRGLRGFLALLLCMVTLSGCGFKGDTRVVFTTGLGREEVFRIEKASCSLPELIVYLTTIQNQYKNVYGEEIWNASYEGISLEENIKETALARIAQRKTMYLLAQEKGVTLTQEEEERTVKAAETYFSSLNEAEKKALKVTQDVIEGLYREWALADKVYQVIIKDINPEISDDEARTISVQHILTKSYDTAREAYALAAAGEQDFEDIAAQYSEDDTITCSFRKGEMDPAFEEAAFLLETGEVSPVVETQAGYHVIKCISTFNREETDANKIRIVEQRRKEAFEQEYEAFMQGLSRQMNEELWEEVTLIKEEEVRTDSFFEVFEMYFS